VTATTPASLPDYSISLSPSSRTVPAGTSTSYTVTVTGLNSFNGTVNFGVSSLPAGATGSFSPTSVTGSGSTTLTINTTSGASRGSSTINVTSTSGSLSHGSSGTLVVEGNGPTADSVSPSSGSGASQVFTFQFSDPGGYNELSIVWFVFSPSTFASGCKAEYLPRAHELYLTGNTPTTMLGPVTPGIAGTLSNSYCTLDAGKSSVSGSGNTLTLSVALTFQSTLAGMQHAYLYAIDQSGLMTLNWVDVGMWNVTP
jgi:hypothetical protein